MAVSNTTCCTLKSPRTSRFFVAHSAWAIERGFRDRESPFIRRGRPAVKFTQDLLKSATHLLP